MSSSNLGHRDRRVEVLAILAMVGVAIFVGVVMLLPAFRSEYSPLKNAISDYAVGRYGYVQTAAFICLGFSSLALALGLYETTRGLGWARVGCVLVGIRGIGLILAGVFPTHVEGQLGGSATGTTHIVVTTLSDISLIAAMFMFGRAFGQDDKWRSFRVLSLGLGVMALAAFLVTASAQGTEWFGIPQRIFVATLVLWMLFTAIRLRVIARATSA
jgi:hypothetical membrane protein